MVLYYFATKFKTNFCSLIFKSLGQNHSNLCFKGRTQMQTTGLQFHNCTTLPNFPSCYTILDPSQA